MTNFYQNTISLTGPFPLSFFSIMLSRDGAPARADKTGIAKGFRGSHLGLDETLAKAESSALCQRIPISTESHQHRHPNLLVWAPHANRGTLFLPMMRRTNSGAYGALHNAKERRMYVHTSRIKPSRSRATPGTARALPTSKRAASAIY